MPWQPLPRIARAVASYPFVATEPAELPLEIGDELYIFEETANGNWLRGYLVAPPSILAGLTSVKGQTLEARVFTGIFPRSCVEVREVLVENEESEDEDEGAVNSGDEGYEPTDGQYAGSDSAKSGVANGQERRRKDKSLVDGDGVTDPEMEIGDKKSPKRLLQSQAYQGTLSVPVQRQPGKPRPPAPVPMLKIGDETPTSASEPLIDEIASALREYQATNLHELMLSRRYSRLDRLSELIRTLYLSRQQLLHNVLTTGEYEKLREKTVWDLVRANKLCSGEVIVRDPRAGGRVLTGDDSVIEITKLQTEMSLLDEPPLPPTVERTALHHVMVDLKGFQGTSSEPTSLSMYLASKTRAGMLRPLSETYVAQVPGGGQMGQISKSLQIRTLFTDLSSVDVGDVPSVESELFLVVRIRAPHEIAVPANPPPSSRSGSTTQGIAQPSTKDGTKPPLTSGNRSMRRSLMWAGKSTRTAFSRGGTAKLDALSEQGEEPPPPTPTPEAAFRGERQPPGSVSSKSGRTPADAPTTRVFADRTVGVGFLKLNSIVKQGDHVEQIINVWAPSDKFAPERHEAGDEWDPIIRDIIGSKSDQLSKSRRAERLQVHIQAFNSPDADMLIKTTPTTLSGICKTNKIGFTGAPSKPRSDMYVTIDEAVLTRQTLLSRYGGSATSLPSSVHCTNLQVSLELRRDTGERIEHCIYPSSNTGPVSTWKSAAVEGGEFWRQTLRLLVAADDVSHSHLVLHVADLPNPPFALAFMPLWQGQAFVQDGMHSLLLYKMDENTVTPQPGVGGEVGYLSLPHSPKGKEEHSADVTGPLAMMRVESFLCSTKLSQDRVVLGLIGWKEGPREDILEMLKRLVFVTELEIVKLLNDVLDALFGILVEYSGSDEYEDLVFMALVRVLDIGHDRRFNLAPLVNQYAESKFNYPFATPCLMRSFTRLLATPAEPETARKLRATFKVARHVLKFITHARVQQKEKEAGIGITGSTASFSRHVRSIFKALDAMMKSSAPVLVGSQTLAVQHFHTWLPELTGLLTTEEIVHVAIDFMDSCASVKGKLVLYKLILIVNYTKLDVFAHPEQRTALSVNTARWIAPHWGHVDEMTEQWRDQVRLCCSILSSQVHHLAAQIPDYVPKIIDSYLAIQSSNKVEPLKSRLSLLFPTQYPFPTKPFPAHLRFDEALIELSAVLSALSNSPGGMQLELADQDLHVVIENCLRVHMSILQGETFPTSWLSVHIYYHKSTMRTLQYLAGIMLETFLPDPDEAENFDTELWKLYFTTLLKLVGSPSLALETFPEQKRRAVWKIAGDVREHGAELLRRTWEAIGWETTAEERARYGLAKMGGYQVQYVPSLVAPIVELCLSVHEGLRRMAVEVLQTMIVTEWTLNEELSVVQTEMIDSLDQYLKSQPLTESMLQKLFVQELLNRFEPLSQTPDDPLHAALADMMATISEFLDLLVAVHSADGEGEASHLIHRLRLMEFLRDMQKEDIFIRYVHQLATLQAESRNHTEAGLALRLHADLYEWDPSRTTPVLQDPYFPAQSHFDRKEQLYFGMIKHFEDGQAWGSALDAYKELQNQYETNVFDFSKLARTQRAVAAIYETISNADKLVPKYFRVVYRGLGFTPNLRDKDFIFEGLPGERHSAFMDHMQEQYPAAQIVAAEHPDDSLEGQYLVVSAVTPHRDLGHRVFQRARVPQLVRDYLLSRHPQKFSVSSKRSTTGPVESHFAEKIVYEAAEAFPTILGRSEIVRVREVRLSAKETAIERIVRKTAEMGAVERKVAAGHRGGGMDEEIRLLADAVAISVNAESDNSMARYRELLPKSGAGEEGREGDEEAVNDEAVELTGEESAIKMALVDHALLIKRCLATFARSGTEVLERPLGDLQRCFASTYAPELAIFMPVQPARDFQSTPSTPAWSQQATPPAQHKTPGTRRSETAPEAEESTLMQPVPLRQGRGVARLSFLGGRKKETNAKEVNGDGGGGDEARKSTTMERLSFFGTKMMENASVKPVPGLVVDMSGANGNGYSHDHNAPANGRSTPAMTKATNGSEVGTLSDGSGKGGKGGAVTNGSPHRVLPTQLVKGMSKGAGGIVRKRLSLLKLGVGRKGKSGGLGGLGEE